MLTNSIRRADGAAIQRELLACRDPSVLLLSSQVYNLLYVACMGLYTVPAYGLVQSRYVRMKSGSLTQKPLAIF